MIPTAACIFQAAVIFTGHLYEIPIHLSETDKHISFFERSRI